MPLLSSIWCGIVRCFYCVCATRWLRYFANNGARQWVDSPRFSGWREPCDRPALFGYWTAMTNTLDFYYAAATVEQRQLNAYTVEESRQRMLTAKMQQARDFLETFLSPECRCRVGYHWKCRRHGKWCG